jgi:hypothetical protein
LGAVLRQALGSERARRPSEWSPLRPGTLPSARTRDLESHLADLLDRVIDWLQFAESKNTGIVGLIATALGLIVAFLEAGPSVPTLAGAGLVVGAVALLLSLFTVIASFLPVTDLERALVGTREPPGPSDNLTFYGHLARYEPQALIHEVARSYVEVSPDEVPESKFATDLAVQIVTNARITLRKLRLFRAAVLLFGVGVLIAAGAMALAAVMR